MKINSPLISVEYLLQNLDSDRLIVLNATLPKVASNEEEVLEETFQIPGARFFDIKNEFSDVLAPFPNTMLSPEFFSKAAKKLGVFEDSVLVVYDEHGIYSSARVWWMFKALGHKDIAVLDGGFKAWTSAGLAVEKKKEQNYITGDFEGRYKPEYFANHSQVLMNITDRNSLLVDARGESRFLGQAEEPRKGLRSGHIPGSVNLPYSDLLENNQLKSKEQLVNMFQAINPVKNRMIFSCGSGITACVLALGAELAGMDHNRVYDGSWTEWGSLEELPVEKT